MAGGRVDSVDRLIDAVRGVEPPAGALRRMQAYVSKLRALLQDTGSRNTRLVRRAPGFALGAAYVDVVEFRRLAEQAAEAMAAR